MDVDDDPPWPGRWAPLGASPTGDGTNFALWAPRATAVDLCLYSDDGRPGGGGAEERVMKQRTCARAT